MESILNKFDEYVLVYDKNNTIKFCNKKLLAKLGYKIEEVIGLNITKIVCETYNNKIGEPGEGFILYTKDNHNVNITGELLTDKFNNEESYFIIGKEHSDKLYSLKDLEIILDNIEIGACIKENRGRYIYGNRDFNKLSGVQKRLREELYKNYNTLIDIKNFDSNQTDLYKALFAIGTGIASYAEACGLLITLYDENNKSLLPFIKIGEANKNLEDVKSFQISDESIEMCLNDIGYRGVKPREEVIKHYIELKPYLLDIEYVGVYSIKLGNEFIGTLNILYKNNNTSKYDQDDFIKALCNKIAILVKNYRLSKELKKESEKRTATEKELEIYLNTSVDLIGAIGRDGCFKCINNNWSKVLGWSKEEILSMNIMDLAHQDDIQIVDDFISECKNLRNKLRLTFRVKCKDGNYIYLDWSLKYLEEKDALVATVKDITEYKKFEEEKSKLEEAIKIESVKNEFFANISHEFKTPLNIILGTMQLIRKNIEQENITLDTLSKHTNIIKQNSYRLLRLVNNLIDISRIDIGYYELNLSNQNIVKIIEDITLSVADYVENRNIDLIFDTDVEEIITACDPDKIERVVLNILSNAIKYTPKGGKIEVQLKVNDNKVFVSIKDSGIGIPNEKLDFIFERFGQVQSTLSKMHEGSGIGLSLVKSILNLHGGDIGVFSKVGEGTEFVFELPIKTLDGNIISKEHDNWDYHIEKCNIEFSDIYS